MCQEGKNVQPTIEDISVAVAVGHYRYPSLLARPLTSQGGEASINLGELGTHTYTTGLSLILVDIPLYHNCS